VGKPLGEFKTTGYTDDPRWSVTYSGTIPTVNRTIAADTSILPIGTKVMVNGIVYTVEDIGSAVKGKIIDIYYSTYEEAERHGTQKAQVYLIEEVP
ncbi:MAG: 3D domain-containing protein, partial [Lachnospiraceae bacterium]|jgi:3D (Asp-Asp-Asp) domain-containing protein|nr:3D domain-containing protein [Lachnospiraceae bacterium]